VNGFDEAAVLNRHRKVDGVEIRFAVKATSEIRARVDGRLRLTTQGADEDQLVVSALVRPTQVGEEPGEVDFVPQTTQQGRWEATWHGLILLR
jgi:hypothetical protein